MPTNESATLSVIVPCLNPGQDLVDCVKSVVEQGLPGTELILVDNGSTDGSVEHFAALWPGAAVVQNTKNEGFGRACNQGAALATGSFLLFLNSDVTLGAESLAALLKSARSSGWPIVQPRSYRMDGQIDSLGKAITNWGFLLPAGAPDDAEAERPVFAADGACMLVERDTFELLGGFDGSYFAYFEDADLCWRARMAGFEVGVVDEVSVCHAGQSTTRRILSPAQAAYLSYRNRLRSVIANASGRTLRRMLPLQLTGMAGACLGFLSIGRWREAASVARALAWPAVHIPEMRAQRRAAQAARRVPDGAVFRAQVSRVMTPSLAIRLLGGSLRRWKRWT